MSKYPKVLKLCGKTHILSPSDVTWYRIDSTEDEKRIREQHAELVLYVERELENLFWHELKANKKQIFP